MTDRPIPRRGLLGCWFLDDRGITYDSGANEAIDRSGRGNHATYQNGVTVGVSGDPSRDFGAAAFDASSNQFADVGDPLAVEDNNAHAVVAVAKVDALDGTDKHIIDTVDSVNGYLLRIQSDNRVQFIIRDDSGGLPDVLSDSVQSDTYFSAVGFFDGTQVGLYLNNTLEDTSSSSTYSAANDDANIGRDISGGSNWNGEIAAVGRYDLTVPNAPEPSEIARRWDRLTDIPATR